MLPAILSKDVVGTVSQVGDGITDLQIGDRVMSLGSVTVADSSQSGLQQYALADAVNCAKVPDNISDDEAVRYYVEDCATRPSTDPHIGDDPDQRVCRIRGSFRGARSVSTMARRQASSR